MKLIIIGAGPGGYETAVEAARRGVEVVIVSDGPVGGTCLNEGCIPTKALVRNAEVLDTFAKAGTFGVSADWSVDFAAVQARKEAVVAQLRDGVEFLLRHRLITLLQGRAALKDTHTVTVQLAGGGGVEVTGDAILVATGSVPTTLPVPGADLCLGSKEILSLTRVPERLAVIGGGVIGLEFASIYRSFGSEVTVLEYCPTILPRFDADLAKRLKIALSRRGIAIGTSAAVEAVEKGSEGLEVRYRQKDRPGSVTADAVLMAVGRRPALGSLDFAGAGVETTPRGVVVNAYMQTSVPSIYAVGDITGGLMLAHAATFQGRRALNHLLAGQPAEGAVDAIRLDLVPAAVFTGPEAAAVGLTEEECIGKGLKVKCLKSQYRANGKAVAMDEPEGFCKVIVEEGSGRILGCHLFGAHASDLVHEACALMNAGGGLSEWQAVIHAHPALSEVLQAAVSA